MFYDFWFKNKITGLGQWIVSKINLKLTKIILRIGKDNKKIKLLEIGHGRGEFADTLSYLAKKEKKNLQYIGIESNYTLSQNAKKKGYQILNIKIPPFPKSKSIKDFDIIYMSHVLEHFSGYNEASAVLQFIYKSLKKDGFFVLFAPDYLDYKEDYFTVDYSHEFILMTRRIKHLFTDHGFTIKKIKYSRGNFLSPWTRFIYFFHFLIKLIAGILYSLTNIEIFFKLKITFGRNIIVVGQKREN